MDRCFGMLVSPGRNVRHSDMQLLESVKMGQSGAQWAIQGSWDPREAAFAVLNQVTKLVLNTKYTQYMCTLTRRLGRRYRAST